MTANADACALKRGRTKSERTNFDCKLGMSRTAPMVSVCLLTYNHAQIVGEVLRSIARQKYTNFELIVSDDCSSDGTWDIVWSFVQHRIGARAVQTPTNVGMARNTNYAVQHARGDYVLLLHHDDICSPDMLARLMSVVEDAPSVGFVFNDYLIAGKPIHRTQGLRFQRVMKGSEFLRKHLLQRWGCPVRGTALIRRACFEDLGGMDDRFSLLADIDMWMRLSAKWDIGYVAEPLLAIHHHPANNYPKEYVQFTWRRLKLLYEIHATNIGRLSPDRRLEKKLVWLKFRARVTLETDKWLIYAFVRRKPNMLKSSFEGATPYELPGTNLLRRLLCSNAGPKNEER